MEGSHDLRAGGLDVRCFAGYCSFLLRLLGLSFSRLAIIKKAVDLLADIAFRHFEPISSLRLKKIKKKKRTYQQLSQVLIRNICQLGAVELGNHKLLLPLPLPRQDPPLETPGVHPISHKHR